MNKTTPYSDKKILQLVRKKGETGWNIVCSQFDPLIKSIARWPKWNFSEHEQQDVCQNIHLQLQTALPNFKQQSSLSWFIKKIAIHQCINEIRRQKRWRTVMTPAVQKTTNGNWNEMEFTNPEALDPHHEAVQKERKTSLRSALRHLNQTCRDSIAMFYMQHLSYQEMAEKLGLAKNTVGSRLSKCLDKLHKNLRQHPAFKKD